LEYHNINPRDGLYYGLEESGAVRRICTDAEIEDAIIHPPQNTRARGRSEVINALMEKNWPQYLIDWDWIRVDKERHLELRNPFHDYQEEAARFIRELV
jgi:proteasome accessory factor A